MTKSNESPIIPGIYADPTVDFAFKRIFGTEKYKDAAIGLINSIIPGSPEYFFFDLVRFAKKLEEITDEKDFWLYSLRESRNQSTMPEVLKGRPGFDAYYEASRCAGFTKEESDSYIKDMMTEIDINISMREQRAEGFAEGLAEGEAKGKAEIARAMKAENLPLSSISKFTGLSIDEIERL